jgi:hypothetical protein
MQETFLNKREKCCLNCGPHKGEKLSTVVPTSPLKINTTSSNGAPLSFLNNFYLHYCREQRMTLKSN